MIDVKRMTDARLHFVARDCYEAIQANPDNPKVYQFLQDRSDCNRELEHRNHIRNARQMIREHWHDKLAVPLRQRRWVRNSLYDKDRWRSGCWLVGWYRRVERDKRHFSLS